ncbi:hypothetical protein BDV39DRAFT_208373 [Aspergillus sergii]|uniref:Uncharacterized protein n=1 Tax=Aspergillus sergii TaxID=1034303 RepID=A0A5N6WUQ4_9EURO|nr:hypothetical protein BDV39DRAFT_208373 [Aspergillus sergii]
MLALIGPVFHLMGFHIAYGSSTHKAADVNCQALLGLIENMGLSCCLIRGVQANDRSSRVFVRSQSFRLKAGRCKEAEDNHKTNEASISVGAQILILEVAQDIATSDKDPSYSLPELSLEHHILREIDMAKETGRALPSYYPSEDQKALSNGFICFDDVVRFEGPEVDMFDRLHLHLQHIREEPLGEWKSEEQCPHRLQ